MEIDREKVRARFAEYVKPYDCSDPKIKLKVVHTYKVSAVCEEIAKSLHLPGQDIDLAWMCAMLHDIGRFEQLRRYNTFVDGQSVDHAKLSCDILFGTNYTGAYQEKGILRSFLPETEWDDILFQAIFNHSLFRIDETLDERTTLFCQMLRDADKVDIFRVNIETPLEDIYNVTSEELYHSQVSEGVMNSFLEKHATLRAMRQTPVDYVAALISFVFELVYPRTREMALEQGYLEQLMNFPSENEITRGQFAQIREIVEKFLFEKKGEREH